MSEGNGVAGATRPGFRLERAEVMNWGTFDRHVWGLNCGGDNALLTGDIGSGKSTLVDALTTLLVAPQRITYNRAAGAESRERTLRSYVLGHYRSERADVGSAAKPVALRDHRNYSVILARFTNDELAQVVTLAQVFWWKDTQGLPARFYVIADSALSITEHFVDFGVEVERLRKRLRGTASVEVHESFSQYAASFRRKFGIDGEQALDLFYQTVSLKSVGNLTEFVREHMLEPFPVEDRITALLTHFDDLTRAHEAVLRTKGQIAQLVPLVANCDKHDALAAAIAEDRACRDALRPWFAAAKAALLDERIAGLEAEGVHLADRIHQLALQRGERQRTVEAVRQAISEHGGDRLERIRMDIEGKRATREERRKRAATFHTLAEAAGVMPADTFDAFMATRDSIGERLRDQDALEAEAQNALTEATVDVRQLKDQYDDLNDEITSLRGRRSSIPQDRLGVRGRLCQALGIPEERVPFAGELIQVREGELDWEGAIERILHTFALSVLVADADYQQVAEWVDRTNLRGRILYYRVRPPRAPVSTTHDARSLVRKLNILSTSPYAPWLSDQLNSRFAYTCCNTMEEFRRSELGVTRSGQVKGRGERHEKDDRRLIDDRGAFVLGWSNEGKIRALEKQAADLAARGLLAWQRKTEAERSLRSVQERVGMLKQLLMFESFADLDWKSVVVEIERLERDQRELQEASDVLRTLEAQRLAAELALRACEDEVRDADRAQAIGADRLGQAREQRRACTTLIEQAASEDHVGRYEQVRAMAPEAIGAAPLTVESCDARQQDYRQWLQDRIDNDSARLARLAEAIVNAMRKYLEHNALENEADASVAAAHHFRNVLARLQADDLPRFENRFKALLNENTIREIANFQSQLLKERQTIAERVARINTSLRDIDYNPARYIALQAEESPDVEIREFRQQLRACTDDAFTGSRDDSYSEAKFLQVKQIIGRFRGRDGTVEADRRWTAKVTDVRRWHVFSASERWREDHSEYEHYADSGGKSGGQKEKLAYTVLAASLAYQFGLGMGVRRPRSFHFVLIDEAFGRGSDESARYGLALFGRLNLQLLVVTPMQKIHVIEPFVSNVGFVHNENGRNSMVRNLTIEAYRAERAARRA